LTTEALISYNRGHTLLKVYANSRIIHAGVTESNWPPFIKEVYRILKPGTGWAQCMEFGYPYCLSENDSLPQDATLSKVTQRKATGFNGLVV